MTVTVRPFLMFQGGKAEEAMNFYTAVLPEARIDTIDRYGEGGPGKAGTVRLATFSVGDQSVMCIDSPVAHAFTFTPAFSFFVTCRSEEDLRRFAAALGEGGGVMMPPGNYGFSRLFTWLNDRFGISWQLNLP
jgi:predicted 3-demethylubiquinone-9 3-methyltransferase (glyoxalase superfamily)